MKGSNIRSAAMIISGIVLLIVLGALAKLFIIGEPVDGKQVYCTSALNGQNLELHVASADSAVAFRGWKYEQDGNTLFISGRKVPVSPLFGKEDYDACIDISSIDQIYLGGQLIWQREG